MKTFPRHDAKYNSVVPTLRQLPDEDALPKGYEETTATMWIAFPPNGRYITGVFMEIAGMKIWIALGFIILLAPLHLKAQPFWRGMSLRTTGSVCSICNVKSNYLFAAIRWNGIYKSSDNGLTWEKDSLSIYSARSVIVDQYDNVFAGASGAYNVYCSSDYGKSWGQIGANTSWSHILTIGKNNELYSGTEDYGILATTDRGANWLSLGLDTIGAIKDIAVIDDNTLFASEGQKLYRTTNLGATWDDLSAKMPGYKIRCISTDANGGIYVGAFHPGVPPNVFPDGVILISKDRGETWSFHRTPNWNLNVNDIAVTSIGDIIAITEDYSIMRSTDDGATWEGFYDGFIHDGGSCITVTPTGRVFVGAGGTVYELMNYPTSSSPALQSASSIALDAVYPNPVPAGGNASIGFSLPKEEYITLTLYNTTGRLVATVAQGVYQPGAHIVTLRTADVPAGMYLCRIVAGQYQASRAVQVR